MNVTQKWLLGTGALILVVTNAVALIGVAYNRMGPPESVLALTEREFNPQWSRMGDGENSGMSVELLLRTELAPDTRRGETEGWGTVLPGGFGWAAAWFDQEKLATLGFDVSVAPGAPAGERHYDRMLEKEVFLVLELDGAARSRALQYARDQVAHLEQQARDGSDDKGAARRLDSAREALRHEEQDWSRLFVIDAGLDEDQLRRQYPDRTHYALVRGKVRPAVVYGEKSAKLYGSVTALLCQSIHVPLLFRSSFAAANLEHLRSLHWPAVNKKPLTVQVAFGKRLEPWIETAEARTP
jgi:Domain of unknown function (DUF4824)